MRLQKISGRQIGYLASEFFIAVCVLFSHGSATAAAPQSLLPVCESKPQTVEVGRFSTSSIDEASGLALSSDGQSFFVINDSGDKPRFFRTKLDGSRVEEFRVKESLDSGAKDWKPWDPEEIAVGPCPKDVGGECIVLADIGDNKDKRKSFELVFIRLADLPTAGTLTAPSTVAIAKRLKLKYPDGPRNAESFAVLNSRFGMIISKEQDRKSREAKPVGVYVVDFDNEVLSRVAEWDVPAWVKDQGLSGLVTSATVAGNSPPGSLRVLMLTYRDAVEVVVSTDILSSSAWPPRPWSVRSRSTLKIDPLDQQEAVTFDKNGTGFYYTTEAPFVLLGTKTAAIRWVEKMTCP